MTDKMGHISVIGAKETVRRCAVGRDLFLLLVLSSLLLRWGAFLSPPRVESFVDFSRMFMLLDMSLVVLVELL
jgi:hypothetical protein